MSKTRGFILLALLALGATTLQAQSVTVSWDPNTEPDVTGYVVFYGTQSGVYAWNQAVGNVTTATVNNLSAGQTYYFAVQAVSSSGLTSPLSGEVSTTIPGAGAPSTDPTPPPTPPPACSIVASANAPSTAAAGASLSFQATATAANCGSTLVYAWSFGDGSSAVGAQVSHAYQAAGQYTWTMTVTSGSSSASRTGTVSLTTPTGCTPITVPVSATAAARPDAVWQSTGITVSAGDALNISVPNATWSNGGRAWTAAGNSADITSGPNCSLSGAPRMALVGRIGSSGTPFLVGTGYQGTARATGPLYLAPNDDWYLTWDNAGSLNVAVCSGGATAQPPQTTQPPEPDPAPSGDTSVTQATVQAATALGLDHMWQSTGVTLTGGASLTITAAAGSSWVNGERNWTADGNASDPTGPSNSPMPGAPRMALVGRIGTGAPFLVGSHYSGTASASGPLQLAPNDDWYVLWDNRGSLTVSIATGSGTPACQVQATATAPAVGLPGTSVVFTSLASATSCPSTVTYDWNFGDGSVHSTDSNPGHVYQSAGNYSWSLTARAGTASVVRSGSISISANGSGTSDTTVTASVAGAPPTNAMWQPAGISVSAGDTLSITANNSWLHGGQPVSADGQAGTAVLGPNTPLSGARLMALIGRIGATGTPFLVGSNYRSSATATGPLYLAPNDNWYTLWDNGGTLSVSLTVSHVTAAPAPVTSWNDPVTVDIIAAPPGTAMWQSTGVSVAAGDTLSIAADNTWTNAGQPITADGQPGTTVVGVNTTLSGAPLMALVGRIGATGAPFLVGSNYQATSVASGTLFLAPNDNWYTLWDNAGALSVTIAAGAASTCSVEATGSAPSSAVAGGDVSFSGSASSNCGGAVAYSWDFGDGSAVSAEQNPDHVYSAPGVYTWTLTTRDGNVGTRRSGTIAVASNGSCTPSNARVLAATTGGLTAMWQSTGIAVTAGVPVTISAPGSWMNGALNYAADGDSRQPMTGQNVPLSGAPLMSLVGRVGSGGTPFKVGSSFSFTPSASGVLFLATNDYWYTLWDNSGSLTVTVCR